MTRIEYDLLREDRPDLKLPAYTLLWPEHRIKLEGLDRNQLITLRAAVLLSRDIGVVDNVLMGKPHESV